MMSQSHIFFSSDLTDPNPCFFKAQANCNFGILQPLRIKDLISIE